MSTPTQTTVIGETIPPMTITPVAPPAGSTTGAGDASAANQATEISYLQQLNVKIQQGQKDQAHSTAVVIASDQTPIPVVGSFSGPVTMADGANVTLGTKGDAGVTTDTTGSAMAFFRGIVKLMATVISGGAVTVNGSGSTQPVSGTVTAISGTAGDLKVDISGTAANGTAIKVDGSAVTQPASLAGGSVTDLGAKADSAASSDTGTFSLIALVKRLLQGITTLTGGVLMKQPAVTVVASTAYEANHVITNSANKVLRSIVGFNSKNAAQWIQIHDAASLPSNGTAPLLTFYVLAQDNFNIPCAGLKSTSGFVVANSTTGPTLTPGGTDCFFTAQLEA